MTLARILSQLITSTEVIKREHAAIRQTWNDAVAEHFEETCWSDYRQAVQHVLEELERLKSTIETHLSVAEEIVHRI
jgi:hypothetical protein